MEDRSGEWANGETHGYDAVRGGLWILSGVFGNIHIICMLRTSVLFSSSSILEIFSEPKESKVLLLLRLRFELKISGTVRWEHRRVNQNGSIILNKPKLASPFVILTC